MLDFLSSDAALTAAMSAIPDLHPRCPVTKVHLSHDWLRNDPEQLRLCRYDGLMGRLHQWTCWCDSSIYSKHGPEVLK